jgi:UDP-N-acetylmuramyl pentapeptide synthase
MRWVELAEVVGGDIDVTDASIEIFDVEHDSRRVRPGVLFACISGANVDGHDFAQQAVTAGASGDASISTCPNLLSTTCAPHWAHFRQRFTATLLRRCMWLV